MVIPASMVCRCLRCGHEWIKRIDGRPRQCAACKETNWDVPAGKLQRGRPPTKKAGKRAAATRWAKKAEGKTEK
jgi:hypothetical protein